LLARRRALTVAGPCLLAAALTAYQLSSRSLWLDESATVAIASQHGSELWHAIAHDGGNMLLYYLLEHVMIVLFGHGEVAIRLPSVIATIVTAGLTAELGRRLFDERVGLAAGVLTAVSLPLVFWGQDARGYALMTMLVAASFLCLVLLDQDQPPRWAIWGYGLTLALALYVGFTVILVVPAQLILFRRRRVIVALGAVALTCVPLLVLALERGSGQLFWVPGTDWAALEQTARWLTSAGMPPNFHLTATGTVLLLITGAALLGAVVLTARDAPVAAAWLVLPAGLALLLSLAGEPVELTRATVMLLPAVALLLAVLLLHPRVPSVAAWSAIAVLVALRALQLGPSYGQSPEDWRSATRYVLANATVADCVAFYPQDGRQAFAYYIPAHASTLPRPVLPAAAWSEARPYVEQYAGLTDRELSSITSTCPRLWLISSHSGQRDGPAASRVRFARYQSLLTALVRGYAHQRGRSFGWAAVVRVTLFSG
jgi:mannosyltransferase